MLNRRNLLKKSCAALLLSAAATSLGLTGGCKKEAAANNSPGGGGDGKTITVGFIYVGTKTDYGYNQAHHEGAEVAKQIPGVKVIEQESVKETDDVQKAMEAM